MKNGIKRQLSTNSPLHGTQVATHDVLSGVELSAVSPLPSLLELFIALSFSNVSSVTYILSLAKNHKPSYFLLFTHKTEKRY